MKPPHNSVLLIKGHNDRYWCSNMGVKPIEVNRTNPLGWVKFTIIHVGDDKIALRNFGRWVSSENGGGIMKCDRWQVQDWELFTWVSYNHAKSGTFSLMGNNGKFVGLNEYGNLECNRDDTGVNEIFTYIRL